MHLDMANHADDLTGRRSVRPGAAVHEVNAGEGAAARLGVERDNEFERAERRGQTVAGVGRVDRRIVLDRRDGVAEKRARPAPDAGGRVLETGHRMARRPLERAAERLLVPRQPAGDRALAVADRTRRAATRRGVAGADPHQRQQREAGGQPQRTKGR